ncbi:MAG: hypothetical protein ACRDRH_11115 [Pseudonocardia sp.]
MLDPQADTGRRAWLPCPHCGDTAGLYLLDSEVNLVWVQCGNCQRRWWHDTGFGRGGRPDGLLINGLLDVA